MRGGVRKEEFPFFNEWLAAFWELSTERQIGMSVGPVPSSSIKAWIKDNGLTDKASLFWQCIRAMDEVYLHHVATGDKSDKVSNEPLRPGMLRGRS